MNDYSRHFENISKEKIKTITVEDSKELDSATRCLANYIFNAGGVDKSVVRMYQVHLKFGKHRKIFEGNIGMQPDMILLELNRKYGNKPKYKYGSFRRV